MSQRRSNVIVFPSSKPNLPTSKLNGVKCKMSPVTSSKLPSVAMKAARLQVLRPAAAELLEKLVDDLLEDLG